MDTIIIPQHKDFPKHLYDIVCFLEDIDMFFAITEWEICIEWCTGDNSERIEELSKEGLILNNIEFRNLYRKISQTIDGKFELRSGQDVKASMLVVDSSYWEIKSKNEQFLTHMRKKYGEYYPNS